MAKSTEDAAAAGTTAESVSKTIKARPGKKLTDKVKGGKKGVNLSKVAEELYQRKVDQTSDEDEKKDK